MNSVFTRRVIESIILYSIVSGFCISFLVYGVIIPALSTPIDLGSLNYLVATGFQLLITVLIIFAVTHNSLDLIDKARRRVVRRVEGPMYPRFDLNQRIQHVWLFATTAILVITGFAQLYYEQWGRIFVNAIGGLQVSMSLHLLCGFLLGILVAYHFGFYTFSYLAARVRGQHPRLPMMLNMEDIKQALQNVKRLWLGRGEEPKYGKYDYAQKFDYWGIYWGMVILGLPGVIMWAYGTTYLGGLPFIFHTSEALLAALFLMAFHFYMAHWTPRDFPMNPVFLTGSLSEGEMRDQHPAELDLIKAEGEKR